MCRSLRCAMRKPSKARSSPRTGTSTSRTTNHLRRTSTPYAADDEAARVRPEIEAKRPRERLVLRRLDDRKADERAERREEAPDARAPVDEVRDVDEAEEERVPRRVDSAGAHARDEEPDGHRAGRPRDEPRRAPPEARPDVADGGDERELHRDGDCDEHLHEARIPAPVRQVSRPSMTAPSSQTARTTRAPAHIATMPGRCRRRRSCEPTRRPCDVGGAPAPRRPRRSRPRRS